MNSVGMGIFYGLLQHCIVKISFLIAVHTHIKMLAPQIYSISPCLHSSHKGIPIPCRSQKLHGFTVQNHCLHYSFIYPI